MASRTTNKVLMAAVAGLLTVGAVGVTTARAAEGDVKCYGVNKCKGMGECGQTGHSCAGKNDCAGKGWLKIDKERCLKIKDGRLTEEPEKPAAK